MSYNQRILIESLPVESNHPCIDRPSDIPLNDVANTSPQMRSICDSDDSVTPRPTPQSSRENRYLVL